MEERNGLELTQGHDLELSVLDPHQLDDVPGSAINVWSLCDQHQHHLGTGRNANSQFHHSPGKIKRNIMPLTLQRKRREVQVTKAKRKCGVRSALPVRLTSCIFQKPLTRITSHPGNKVRRCIFEERLEKPQQISAYNRLQALQACSSGGDLLSPFNFANALDIIAMRIPGESLSQSGSGGLHSEPQSTRVQSSNWAERIPRRDLHLPPSLHSREITYADIRRQMRKVKKARERLAEALRADRLASEAERMRSQMKT
ncbi:methyl-CpG-binding domain protein 3-like 2B [Cynocephalus volans]|uniref:methyl-CpG-binding domain protein 3-like 2B n=1 Tax=Cynocephalus volans TaxID=110931 RepID=UPI002FC8A358